MLNYFFYHVSIKNSHGLNIALCGLKYYGINLVKKGKT